MTCSVSLALSNVKSMSKCIVSYILKLLIRLGCISFQNSPKYISCLNPELELQFQYKVHTSLDVVEEKLSSIGKTSSDVRELYLGLLYSTEEHKMYPSMFRKLHTVYTDVVCNPFYIPGDPVVSKSFDTTVKNIMTGNA
ncbi:hypothetical protein Cfor_01897 [Coptotermes formosanus]|uniref:Trafficking protein particle complex subunit 2-like protein n=1 Tax=Coptotermes formosanus TaxID=36987 RepID=A0A6L2Q0B6_COPFO|nr:hypothetical protein Cfor_01897 [Coptotermes formosanus]